VNAITGSSNGNWTGCLWSAVNVIDLALTVVGVGADLQALISTLQVSKGVRAAEAAAKLERQAIEHANDLPSVGGCRILQSFAAATPILMADGTTKAIDHIVPGDKVIATDPEAHATHVRVVTGAWVHDDTLVDLDLAGGQGVTNTEDHLYWNATRHEWQEAQLLRPGDRLLTPTGPATRAVVGIDWTTSHRGAAYNLTVADTHTYYVVAGTMPVLVHNCPSDSPARVSPAYQDWGTKGAHVHIGNHEVRVYPDGSGGTGAKPITTRAGTATADDVASALNQLRGNPELRADLIRQAQSAMDSMNAGEWGMATNRAAEMHFLIQALEAMG
jgi:hypothetical protein